MASILVVDDNLAFRATLKTALERAGHAVVEASNGAEAVRLLDANKVDVVATDILMPDLDGIELIGHLRRANRTMPIVAMSGGARSGTFDVLNPALKLGATVSIAKPFRMADFVALVGQLLTESPALVTDRG
jgi:CheY-like chemotaxis protein